MTSSSSGQSPPSQECQPETTMELGQIERWREVFFWPSLETGVARSGGAALRKTHLPSFLFLGTEGGASFCSLCHPRLFSMTGKLGRGFMGLPMDAVEIFWGVLQGQFLSPCTPEALSWGLICFTPSPSGMPQSMQATHFCAFSSVPSFTSMPGKSPSADLCLLAVKIRRLRSSCASARADPGIS